MEQIRNAFAFVEDVAAISIEPVQQATSEPVRLQSQPLPQPQKGMRAASRETIRVSISKVDYLIDLVGEPLQGSGDAYPHDAGRRHIQPLCTNWCTTPDRRWGSRSDSRSPARRRNWTREWWTELPTP